MSDQLPHSHHSAHHAQLSRRRLLAASCAVLGTGALGALGSTSTPAAAAAVTGSAGYTEPYRPQLHFSPARNWMNDPNGLLHHDGTYHLFFQYNPEGATWGNMSWGHAVSTDLTHWHERGVAIPEDDTEMIFSGSAVFDRENTSGLGTADDPPLVAVYTSHLQDGSRQRQSLAYSTDGGENWRKYEGNPVLDIGAKDFRDPKVFWHAATGRWVMAVALSLEHTIRFYASPDLKNWTHLSDFGPSGATGGIWECPDLFELPVDGDARRTRWVLIVNINPGGPAGGSAGQYFIGDFDGTAFTADTGGPGTRWLDHGADCYAGVTYNDAPEGRRILLAWMNNWLYGERIPTAPWRSAMTFPRELALRSASEAEGNAVLVQQPVAELEGLRGRTLARLAGREVAAGSTPLLVRDTGLSYEVEAELGAAQGTRRFGLEIRAGGGHRTRVGYDADSGELYVDRTASGAVGFDDHFPGLHRAPLAVPEGGTLRLRLLVDASSVEVFAQEGRVCLTDQIFPDDRATALQAFAEEGPARIEALVVRELHSAWR
ncbi:glycoside hydrolase family 32 protein [Streptomyces sp. ODS28]|uniref:glycoside hydrolase family 32 protein n=1 Tax=Streptomyces sp. ODS28 TaxID=3136688 RepID=UPI0031E84AC4